MRASNASVLIFQASDLFPQQTVFPEEEKKCNGPQGLEGSATGFPVSTCGHSGLPDPPGVLQPRRTGDSFDHAEIHFHKQYMQHNKAFQILIWKDNKMPSLSMRTFTRGNRHAMRREQSFGNKASLHWTMTPRNDPVDFGPRPKRGHA